MTDAGDIPSIQCKMSLRKVDGLNLIFIDFYVPALTIASNSSSIVSCVFVVAETYLSSRCLATDHVVMSQYFHKHRNKNKCKIYYKAGYQKRNNDGFKTYG
jgi:hypothetical protein